MMPKTLEEARKTFYGKSYSVAKPSNFVEGRCIEEVGFAIGRMYEWKQCDRKATVDGCWCKQHSPAFIEEKRKNAAAEYKRQADEKNRATFFSRHSEKFYNALKLIAAGHNDSRALAEEILKTVGEAP